MVEYAVAIPVFLLILLGMLEFGFAFSHHLTMEYATREGARAGAALANGSNEYPCAVVDNQVIAAVQRVITAGGSQVDINQITQIRIYNASNADGQEHPGDQVNVWTLGKGPVVDGASLKFKFQNGNWDACQRKNAATPDHIGVSMSYGYKFVTPLGGLLGATGTPTLPMTDRTVMSLNPD
jgi:Flp pilus assembly protein TadG